MPFREWFPHSPDTAPLAREVEHSAASIINALKHLEHRLMAAIDDLKSAINDLSTQLAANNAEIETLLTKITTPGTSDADIAAAVQSIRDLTAANKTEVDKATAATGAAATAP